jgi:hypothetical protein
MPLLEILNRGCILRIRIIGDQSYGQTQAGREGEGGRMRDRDNRQTDGQGGGLHQSSGLYTAQHNTAGRITSQRTGFIESYRRRGEEKEREST